MRDISVLLIEDNCDDEWLAKWILKKAGITGIAVARDGQEALLMLHGDERNGFRESCTPELILLDLRLPKIDGLEVLKRIRSDPRTAAIFVLVLTSSEDPKDKQVAGKLGLTAFFTKPLTKETLSSLDLFQPV